MNLFAEIRYIVFKQPTASLRAVHDASITASQYARPVAAAAPSALRSTMTDDRAIPVSIYSSRNKQRDRFVVS